MRASTSVLRSGLLLTFVRCAHWPCVVGQPVRFSFAAQVSALRSCRARAMSAMHGAQPFESGNEDGFDARPHPNPLPRGEGTVCYCLSGRSSRIAFDRDGERFSLSPGERAGVRASVPSMHLKCVEWRTWNTQFPNTDGAGVLTIRRVPTMAPRPGKTWPRPLG